MTGLQRELDSTTLGISTVTACAGSRIGKSIEKGRKCYFSCILSRFFRGFLVLGEATLAADWITARKPGRGGCASRYLDQTQTPRRQIQHPKDKSKHPKAKSRSEKTSPNTQKTNPSTQKTNPSTQKTNTAPKRQIQHPKDKSTHPEDKCKHPTDNSRHQTQKHLKNV